MPGQPRSGFANVGGLKLHYLEWGGRGRPDVLLAHGWTGLARAWTAIAESLADRHHVVALDHRGHGASEKPEAAYRLHDFVADVCGLIVELGLKRPAFVGHSWGGNVGTILAADHPDLVSCALLEDPVYWAMIHSFVTALPHALARHERPTPEIRADGERRGLTPEQIDDEVYRHRHFAPLAIRRLLEVNRSWALECEGYLARIAVPTLVLVADAAAGGSIQAEELGHLRGVASPQVHFEHWPGVGHMMHEVEPDRFAARLAAFLESR